MIRARQGGFRVIKKNWREHLRFAPLTHHRAAISAAVVLADATTISLAAPAMSFKLTMGMSPF